MQTTDLQAARLSKQQEHVWRWQQDNRIESVQAMFMLQGVFNCDHFQQALRQIVERYEILRTSFSMLPGMDLPIQVVSQSCEISCPLIDLSCLDSASKHHLLAHHWQKLVQQPFHLEGGSLLETFLFHFAEQCHVLTLHICALCADVPTLKYLVTEIVQIYTALQQNGVYARGEEDVLQYIDVSSWQQKLLTSDNATAEQEIWCSFNSDDVTTVSLPLVDKKVCIYNVSDRKATYPFPLQQLPIVLQAIEQQHLNDLSRRYNVSLETCLLALWQILLWRLIGTPSVIGLACDGRCYEELAMAPGPYTHVVPFSLHLDENMSFEQILAETSFTMQEMNEKQLYFSWEVLAPGLEGHEQVFPIAFSFEDGAVSGQEDVLRVTLLEQENWRDPCLLRLQASQVDDLVQLKLTYHPSVFSQKQVRDLADLLVTLLQSAYATPHALIGRLALLSEAQQVSQQERWSGPERTWSFQPLHRLFEMQARLQPEAPAIRSGSQVLSYVQLEQQANQLAHLLLKQKLLPAGRVVLGLPRDYWSVICLLAVLKAGGTYVPLDMDQPTERLQKLLQYIEPALILSSQALAPRLSQSTAPVQLIETLSALLVEHPDTPPDVEVGPEDLAYIMYTSGSTGVPKGVMIRQSSVSNYTQALCELLEVQPGWHFATVSSLAADLGNTSIFSSLASGGCLHVLSTEHITDAAAMQAYGQQFSLDVLKIVPSHLQALLAAGAEAILPHRRLILGGEILPWSLVEQIQHKQPRCHLYNHYGPTETTIGALVYALGEVQALQLPSVELQGSSVPIGRPIANTQVHLLDSQQQWVPDGVRAELYLGGAGVAVGYLQDEKQSKQRFMEVERGGKRHRLYRTGDWVRVREEGVLEFSGRQDTQVKLRGHRIELGEVEEQLRRHPAVRQAVVQLSVEEGREAQLVGYIVPWQQPGPGMQEVRQVLEEQLPAYMVPATLVLLEQLPLTTNGKVDRQRLPLPTACEEERGGNTSREKARTPLVEVMMGVWKEVLSLEQIGSMDNFFRLGGHSLLGMQLISRLRVVFGVEVPIGWLFEAPTAAQLAGRVEALLRGQEYASLPAMKPVRRSADMPLSFAQQRLWFLDQLEPGNTAYNIPITVEFKGELDLEAFEKSLSQLCMRHEGLRTTFQEYEGQPYQVIHSIGRTSLILIDLQTLSVEHQETVARALNEREAQLPFDLRRGPLLRCWLVRLAEQRHWVRLSLHHIVSDGWSRGIFVQELTSFYRTFRAGETVTLPPLPIQYADYASWQRQWLQGEVLKEQIRYWTRRLGGARALELPTDYPRSHKRSHRGARYTFQLNAELTQALGKLSGQEGATLFMTLLAAFQILLSRLSGEQDIVVGTDSANRGHMETEGLIGFFVNLLVLRTHLRDNPGFLDVLHEVREMVLGAYAHQELPFEMIVEHLRLEREGNLTPLVNILLVMQNVPRTETEFPDIVVRPVEWEATHAKFDLALFVAEGVQGLSGSVIYSTDLFREATIAKMISNYEVLLHEIVIHPESTVNNLEIQSAAEKEEGERSAQDRIAARRSKLKKVDRTGLT